MSQVPQHVIDAIAAGKTHVIAKTIANLNILGITMRQINQHGYNVVLSSLNELQLVMPNLGENWTVFGFYTEEEAKQVKQILIDNHELHGGKVLINTNAHELNVRG